MSSIQNLTDEVNQCLKYTDGSDVIGGITIEYDKNNNPDKYHQVIVITKYGDS